MTYTHLSMKELGWIEAYFDIGYKACDIAKSLDVPINPSITLSTSLRKAALFVTILNATHRINRNVGQRKRHLQGNKRNTLKIAWRMAGHRM